MFSIKKIPDVHKSRHVDETFSALNMFGVTFPTAVIALCLIPSCNAIEECFIHDALIHHGYYLLTKILPCNYVKDVLPPRSENQSLAVTFNILVQDINSINAADMDFRVDMFLHMKWRDTRLNLTHLQQEIKKHYIILPSYAVDYIWTPDPFIANSKQAGISSLSKDYASLTLFTNNSLQYSVRFFSIIGCQMEFYQYPRDVQNCSIIFQSFKYNIEEVIFTWRPWIPVQLNPNLKLLQFSLTEPLKHYEHIFSGPSGRGYGRKSQGLVVRVEFKREVGHHLVQTFVPSFLLVALSWFSFWMGLDAIPGRVTLLVTSLLTLFTIFIGIQKHLPPVAYVKAIDVWMGGCIVFIFCALGEFIIVKVLKETQKQNKINPSFIRKPPKNFFPAKNSGGSNGVSHFVRMWEPNPPQSRPTETKGSSKMYDGEVLINPDELRARRIALRWYDGKTGREKWLHEELDKFSRVMFPLAFLLFICIYFPILLTRSF